MLARRCLCQLAEATHRANNHEETYINDDGKLCNRTVRDSTPKPVVRDALATRALTPPAPIKVLPALDAGCLRLRLRDEDVR